MKKAGLLLGLSGLLALVSLPTSSAHAQLYRAYVSGLGNDGDTCSRTAPCRTFAGALSNSAEYGEISCLDTGGYGVATITKSITIDCTGTYAGVLHQGVDGIVVNAPPTAKVRLRGLSFNGTTNGLYGIRFISGGELHVEDVTIENFGAAGIFVNKTAPGILTVRNVSIMRGPVGIKLQATVPNIVASISDSKFNNLSGNGVEVGMNSYAAVSNSVFSTNGGSAIVASTASSTVYARNNMISNSHTGINALVAGARINAAGNGMFGNSKAFNVAAGATFLTAGSNEVDINPGNSSTGNLTLK